MKNLPANKNKGKEYSGVKQAAEAIGNGLVEVGKVVALIAGIAAFGALADHLREKRLEMEGEEE